VKKRSPERKSKRAPSRVAANGARGDRWLLLIHAIPPSPAYFRAKVGRRLARVGAVAIKNSVYVLPLRERTREDFQWIAREITDEGGDATLCEAKLVEGLRDEQVEALFQTARESDYAAFTDDARDVLAKIPRRGPEDRERTAVEADAVRLKKRLAEIEAIDFFDAPGRAPAESALATIDERLRARTERVADDGAPRPKRDEYRGRTWVTRKNIHVDRIASAWLVRRFIDPKATFKFVPGTGYRAKPGEVTFDMFEGDFTHVGDACTFEVLVDRFEISDPGVRPIAEMIHDIDVKDGKFERAETAGLAALIAGIAVHNRDDDARIDVGSSLLDALLALYRTRRASRPTRA
jgi:hypothetical protein